MRVGHTFKTINMLQSPARYVVLFCHVPLWVAYIQLYDILFNAALRSPPLNLTLRYSKND